jgi:glycine/D-amino acid oxidase-like deaminating enzyme
MTRQRVSLLMSSISLNVANSFFNIANVVAIVGAAFVLLGAAGIWWFGGIRERYADERRIENEAKTAIAVAESAKAQRETAVLHESNTRLQLDLEKERVERLRLEVKVNPRRLTSSQKDELIKLLKATGWREAEIIWHGTGEPESYARDLADAFEKANIKTKVHTLGPFIPSGWDLGVVITENGVSKKLDRIMKKANIPYYRIFTNDSIGGKVNPTLFVGNRTQ